MCSSDLNILDFPAKNFVTFFKNHDLMTGLKPAQRWKTISGGSRVYVDEIISRFNGKVETKAEVVSVLRNDNSIKVNLGNGTFERFDHVIFCCNAPTIDRILSSKSTVERNTFRLLETSSNKCVIHSEERGMLNEVAVNAAGAIGTNALSGSGLDTKTGGLAGFDPVLISLIRRAMPNLVAYDICGVQPMSGPTGLIFAMKDRKSVV